MSTQVKAIFVCKDGEHDEHGNLGCTLEATTNGDDWPEFTKYTPGGSISMLMDEDASARDFFEAGETYEVLFRKAKGD